LTLFPGRGTASDARKSWKRASWKKLRANQVAEFS
jgi:hypothetical protein